MIRRMFLMLLLLGLVPLPATAWEDQLSDLFVEQISDRIILVQTEAGYPSQLAVRSSRGLVVFDSMLNQQQATRYRRVIEQHFGRDDFLYVINTTARCLSNGGHAAYPDALVIAHESTRRDMFTRQETLDELVQREVRTFRVKAERSRSILAEAPDSPDADQGQYNWQIFCTDIADHLEQNGYTQKLPDLTFREKQVLDLGDCTLELIDFGRGYAGNYLMIFLPEDGLLMATAFSPLHLAPLPPAHADATDVARWLEVLDELLDGDREITRVACGFQGDWDVNELRIRRDYMRDLWNGVTEATAAGLDFATASERLSIDQEFTRVKDWAIYQTHDDRWVRDDHAKHLLAYWRYQHESAVDVVIEAFQQSGLEAALARFQEIQADTRNTYFVSEAEFNRLGYQLLGAGQLSEAIAVFEMNVAAFPESANTYDSLAEAYLQDGQQELAITNYRRSLKLNPENTNAERVLSELGL